MARKKLLTESEIRRFMKLATIGPVGDEKIQEYSVNEQDELDIDAELPGPGGDELDVDLDAEEGVPPVDEPLPPEEDLGAPVDEETAKALASGFAGVIEDVLDVEVTVEGDGAPEGDEEVSLDTDVDLEGDVGGEPFDVDMDASTEEEVPLPPGGRDSVYESYENVNAVVDQVAKRVAARLIRESKKTKMVDDLTERIFNRLTAK